MKTRGISGRMAEVSATFKDLKNAGMSSPSCLNLMTSLGPWKHGHTLVDDSRLLQTPPNSDISAVVVSHTIFLLEQDDMA